MTTTLFLGDNGRCLCGEHLGMTARISGRDISGQPILRLTAEMIRAEGLRVDAFQCETCGQGVGMVVS